jgi:hypothetical protein
MLALLANGDFHVAPNILLIVMPLLTLGLLVAVVVWLIRWSPRRRRSDAAATTSVSGTRHDDA